MNAPRSDLTQYDAEPGHLDLDINGGSALVDGAALADGVTFRVRDPEALRALGEGLLVLAARAENAGMLDALRALRAADVDD